MTKTTQNINLLVECQRRFGSKPWYDASRLNALMTRLSYLRKDEIDLILDLTDRFQYFNLSDLTAKLITAFYKVPKNKLQNATKILFAPLKSPYSQEAKKIEKRRKRERIDKNEPLLADPGKSCDFVFRLMQIDYPKRYIPYDQKICICNKPDDILGNYIKGALIVLWDDFVGSGETAFNAIADLQKFLMKAGNITNEEDYVVVCMCAMNSGMELLDLFSLKCYACDVFMKAITDDNRYTFHEREQRKELMVKVEKKVVKAAVKNYSLGYHQSEALLSILDKCPNNTFPFYWFASQHNIEPVFYRLK
jgi:hypothetical protein